MKKMMMVLGAILFAYCGATAQEQRHNCGTDEKVVCRKSADGVSCYQTTYAKNYKVCKGENGYYICCDPNKTPTAFTMDESEDMPVETAMASDLNCGASEGKVCRKTDKGTSCYKTDYAQNYKVCRSGSGYHICCEEPNGTNQTYPPQY